MGDFIINIDFTSLNLNNDKNLLIQDFMNLFLEYNKKVNLISKNDEKFLFEKHIYDSLAFNLFFSKYFNADKNYKLLDIGAGGGFPSLPISILFDNINITSVDSTLKKIKFIEFSKEKLGLKNINPICKRVEDLSSKNEFDVCVSRAMAKLNIILEYSIPFLKKGAFFAAYKSIKTDEEIMQAKNALHVLNAEIIDKIEYTLPLSVENKRVLIIVKKVAKTNDIYPRKNGLISKHPL